MNWTLAVVLGLVLLAFFLSKRMSFVSAEAARKYLREGAAVIDVRSPEEFRSRHLPGALNIPLGELREGLARSVRDKNQVLLLHCLSGGRSGIAKVQAKKLGYARVFNLGGYGRAEAIVSRKGASPP